MQEGAGPRGDLTEWASHPSVFCQVSLRVGSGLPIGKMDCPLSGPGRVKQTGLNIAGASVFHVVLPGTGARFPLGSHLLLSPPLSSSRTGCLAGLQTEQTHCYLRAFALTLLSAWGALRSHVGMAAPSRLVDVYQCHAPWRPSKTAPPPCALVPFSITLSLQHMV